MARETFDFNGITYYRYPKAKNKSDRVYFKHAGKILHREIWKREYGDIPDGFQVHHKDHNPDNNAITNLEVVPAGMHSNRHHVGVCSPATNANLDRIRPLASAWHRSDEGREWHRQHGKDAWKSRQPAERTCDECGNVFMSITLRQNNRFCSNKCKSKWRRDSGLDDIVRTCIQCGKPFKANKYSRTNHCSLSCRARTACDKRRRSANL